MNCDYRNCILITAVVAVPPGQVTTPPGFLERGVSEAVHEGWPGDGSAPGRFIGLCATIGMQVRIHDIDDRDQAIFRCTGDLHEIFDGDRDEIAEALRQIDLTGRAMVGGGASPLVMLTVAGAA
jgi:hypothetical protein